MRRILIIGVILVGAWFVFQELNAPKEVDVNTEETTTEEEVVTEEGTTEEANEKEEEKRDPIDRTGLEGTTITEGPVTIEVPSEVEEKTFESSETPVVHVTDTVKVFLYEWGIDLSSANVPAGTIAFEVFNNGQFTHHFAIEGGTDFGKVVPGEMVVFMADLEEGAMTLYSPRQIDMANKMQETLYVQ
jgi:hypothetical protein